MVEEYRIASTDAISIRLLANEGFKMVDISGSSNGNLMNFSTIDVVVDQDGSAKLPLIGRIKLGGLTTSEAEQLLETRYSEFYVGAYAVLRVTNKRISVFNGTGGMGRSVSIPNNNTTVFEALALAGGISEDGKSHRIKLVRDIGSKKPKVYLIDLSTIEGIKDGSVVVQANDIIYVETKNRIGRRLQLEVLPYVTLFSSFVLIYSLLRK